MRVIWQAEKADFSAGLSGAENEEQRRPSAVKAIEMQGAALSEKAEAAMHAAMKKDHIGFSTPKPLSLFICGHHVAPATHSSVVNASSIPILSTCNVPDA